MISPEQAEHARKKEEKKDYNRLKERAELEDEDLDSLPHNVYIKLNKP